MTLENLLENLQKKLSSVQVAYFIPQWRCSFFIATGTIFVGEAASHWTTFWLYLAYLMLCDSFIY